MINFTNITLSNLEAKILEYDYEEYDSEEILNYTNIPVYVPEWNFKTHLIIYSIIFVTCVFGLLGNGIVIWLLGFRMKRNAFTIYILNLAVADFAVLMSTVLFSPRDFHLSTPLILNHIAECLFPLTFCTSQLLLTVISMDRCVSVFFPIWHRCHRPPHLSTTVCALIWLLNFLLCGIQISFKALKHSEFYLLLYQFFNNVVFCFPLTTISTLTLLFKVSCKPKQHKRGKLLTVIIITLLFFLIVAFPFNVVILYNFFSPSQPAYLFHYGFLCTSLNSGINPLIYFLVGKKKRGQVRGNIKAILQRLFKEDEEFPEEPPHGQSSSDQRKKGEPKEG